MRAVTGPLVSGPKNPAALQQESRLCDFSCVQASTKFKSLECDAKGDVCTHEHTGHFTAKYLIPLSNCLSCGCLTDIYVSALPDAQCSPTEHIRKHLTLFIAAASISHRSKINTLGGTQTDAHRRTHNLPLIQNTARANTKQFQAFFMRAPPPARNSRQKGLHGRTE